MTLKETADKNSERCVIFSDNPPAHALSGVCSVHAIMLEAEKCMRAVLAAHTVAEIAATVAAKVPTRFNDEIVDWLTKRSR